MNRCQQTRQWLLQAEDSVPTDPDLVDHLGACPACALLVRQLGRLEQAWRNVPVPADCLRAQTAFLERIAPPPQPAPPLPRRPRWPVVLRYVSAALVLITTGLGLWALLPSPDMRRTDVVSRLIDWNLDLSQSADRRDRQRLFDNQGPVLKVAVQKASLTLDDKELAESLLDQANTLKAHDDPLAHADHFTDLADKLVEHMHKATLKPGNRDMVRLTHNYRRVMERGVDPSMARMQTVSLSDGDKKGRLDRIMQREAKRMRALEALLANAPDASRTDIRQTLEMTRKHHHHYRHKGGKSKSKAAEK